MFHVEREEACCRTIAALVHDGHLDVAMVELERYVMTRWADSLRQSDRFEDALSQPAEKTDHTEHEPQPASENSPLTEGLYPRPLQA